MDSYTYKCQNGFELVAIANEPFDDEIVAIVPLGIENYTIEFACGYEISAWEINQVTTPERVFKENFAWLPLIRAGMVPKVDPSVADQLETALRAEADYYATCNTALKNYREEVDSITQEDYGEDEMCESWRYVLGFPTIKLLG